MNEIKDDLEALIASFNDMREKIISWSAEMDEIRDEWEVHCRNEARMGYDQWIHAFHPMVSTEWYRHFAMNEWENFARKY